MAVPEPAEFWPHLLSGGVGTALGVLGTIIVAVLNRQPTMASVIDAHIRVLIESYEKHVADLQREIKKLEAKVDTLTSALASAQNHRPGSDGSR